MKAILKSANLSNSAIEELPDGSGVIRGVRLFEVGGTATYKGRDGKIRSFERTAEVAKALLAHAGNRSIPSHFTHEGEGDPLMHRLGLHKTLRIDEATGNLLSDLHTMPNEYGKLALWTAKTDPNSAAFSAVFGYNPIKSGDKTLAVPTSFDAADFVSSGAACAAMLSQFNQDETDMTPDEIKTLLREELKAALAEHKPALPENLITKEGVEAAVKAALSAHKPALDEDAKKEVAMLAKASATEFIGTQNFVRSTGGEGNEHAFLSKVKAQVATGASQEVALLRAQNDNPDLFNDYQKSRGIFKN